MAGPTWKFRIRTVGRRTFLKAGGAAALAWMAGCDTAQEGEGDSPWQDVTEGVDDALSPITPNDEHYVVAYLGMVDVDPAEWTCAMHVLATQVGSFDYEFLESLPARDIEHTLQCIESNPNDHRMSNAVWSGLPLREVLDAAGLSTDYPQKYLKFHCADGYLTGLPVSAIDDLPLWLVWRMNGVPIPKKNGFPARVLSPGLYGWKNPKQLIGIYLVDEPYIAPWEGFELDENGVPVPGAGWDWEYLVQGLIVRPTQLQVLPTGDEVSIVGTSYAGADPVTWVGISADGGKTFSDAELTYAPGAHRWTLWRQRWRPEKPGTYTFVVACRTASGAETDPNADVGFHPFDGGAAIQVEVTDVSSA